MTARKDPDKPQRRDLGHTEYLHLKLHPDLRAYVEQRAQEDYCSASEWLRRLVLIHMRDKGR